jgi:hypothetical protein
VYEGLEGTEWQRRMTLARMMQNCDDLSSEMTWGKEKVAEVWRTAQLGEVHTKTAPMMHKPTMRDGFMDGAELSEPLESWRAMRDCEVIVADRLRLVGNESLLS